MNPNDTAILLAVYNPNTVWLEELLSSLNSQTQPGLHLFVRNDASTTIEQQELEELLRRHITAFPYTLNRNPRNLGSNGTFEALVRDCGEDCRYVAFCDQDDVWLPDKLKNSLELLTNSPLSPTLVCTDVRVIDGNGRVLAPDIEHHRRRHVFLRGEGLAEQFFFRNFVIGCTTVMERTRVLQYLPFPSGVVHDHYLAFRAACDGALDYLAEPQLLYRVYGGNQTGVMKNVRTKQDYYRERIAVFARRTETFAQFAPELPELPEIRAWCTARERNYHREKGSFGELRRLHTLNPSTTLFELYALRLPDPLFRIAIWAVQKRLI